MSSTKDNRDNFTEETRRIAAQRVGYRCSFPGCPNITIGASMEGARKTSSIGVAAHICAAAPGGKRYDANMSSDERKGIENCIWMCQTHAHLIDTDDKTYTVEMLRQWKADAEQMSSIALANGDYFSEYYRNNGDNLNILAQIFDDMIMDGRYNQLHTMLQQYKTTLSERYEEFVLRYTIIYDLYCSRMALSDHIEKYVGLVCKAGADILAHYFIAFQMVDELNAIIAFCTSPNVQLFASMLASGELAKKILVPAGSTNTLETPPELANTVSKYIVNYICIKKLVGAVDPSGNAYPLYTDEFYYMAVSSAHNIAAMTVYGNGNFDKITGSSEFSFLIGNIDKIKLLDTSLQEYIWANFLTFLSEDNEQFYKYYPQCPNELKNNASIQRAVYICQINQNISLVDVDALIDNQKMIGNYSLLFMYVSSMDKDEASTFLAEHSYLLRQDSSFLRLKCDLAYKCSSSDKYDFLSVYKSGYVNDFTFQLLMAECMPAGPQKVEIIEWLNKNLSEIKNHDIEPYIRLLRDSKLWEDLISLSKVHLPNECLFQIASCLAESDNKNHTNACLGIYQGLVKNGWRRNYLYFNMGCIQSRLRLVEDAKKSFKNEYDEYNLIAALKNLEALRFETHEFIEDNYLEQLKNCIDAQAQNWVGAVYLNLQNKTEARKFFLRSLLLDDSENLSLNGFWQVASDLLQESPKSIKSDTVSILKNDLQIIQVAIHAADILDGIPLPNNFANCSHYSVDDPIISVLLYHEEGDSVSFLGDEYIVESITTTNNAFIKFFFTSLVSRKDVITIKGTTADDLINNIMPILKSSSESIEKVISDYERLDIRYPLTVLSRLVGKEMLCTCEFLACGNQIKIINNLNTLDGSNICPTFILSYDSIVLLTHLDIDLDVLKKQKLLCARQVKNQLLSDVCGELSKLSDDKQNATMFYDDGRLGIIERSNDARRDRNSFLIRLKDFVKSIKCDEEAYDYIPDNPEMKSAFDSLSSNYGIYCESGSLELTKRITKSVLVTDDQFLYGVAFTDGIYSIGLVGLLMAVYTNWEELLEISKQFKKINFVNYLPFPLYKQIVDLLIESEDIDTGSNNIQQWLISDTDKDPSENHENVILSLARDVYQSDYSYLNPEDILGKLAINILNKRDPDFLQKRISEVLKSIRQSSEE